MILNTRKEVKNKCRIKHGGGRKDYLIMEARKYKGRQLMNLLVIHEKYFSNFKLKDYRNIVSTYL